MRNYIKQSGACFVGHPVGWTPLKKDDLGLFWTVLWTLLVNLRVQKAAIRLLILGENYENYEDGLFKAKESQKERREKLCKTFVIKCKKVWKSKNKWYFLKKEN